MGNFEKSEVSLATASTVVADAEQGSLRELARYLSSSSLTHVRFSGYKLGCQRRDRPTRTDVGQVGTDSLQGEQEDTKVQHKDSWHEAIFCLFWAVWAPCCSKTETSFSISISLISPCKRNSGYRFTQPSNMSWIMLSMQVLYHNRPESPILAVGRLGLLP